MGLSPPRVSRTWTTLLLCLQLLWPGAGCAEPKPPAATRKGFVHKGIALGLFAEDPGFSYQPLLREVRSTGASHVSIIVPYYQHSIRSIRIAPHPRYTPANEVVERTLRQAKQIGLKILLFPILRLQYPVTPQEWRGSIQPKDPAAWWQSYSRFMLDFARMAHRHGAAALCIGSELSSMDTRPGPWRELIGNVRKIFSGELIYSANWDHYDKVSIWPLVDLAGLSAYFQLTDGAAKRPSLSRLIHAWREQRVPITRWLAHIGKPLVFTELGYHSQQGTNAWPWDESADKPVSLVEQADCYRAFAHVWRDVPYLHGVYFWTWFGYGGPNSREYCPRGKPATQVICEWFGARPGACPEAFGMPWFSPD